MSSIFKSYLKAVKKQNGYRATWMPNISISVGSVGVLEQGRFTPMSHLNLMGVKFEETVSDEIDFSFFTENMVDIHKKASGQLPDGFKVLGEADAGIAIDFKKEHGIVFELSGAKIHTLKDVISLRNDLKKMRKEGKWQRNWVLATEVVRAEKGTIMLSRVSDFHFEAKANADLGIENLKLTEANLEFVTDVDKEKLIYVKAENGISPLFNVMGFKLLGRFATMGAEKIDEEVNEVEEDVSSIPITDDEIDAITDY